MTLYAQCQIFSVLARKIQGHKYPFHPLLVLSSSFSLHLIIARVQSIWSSPICSHYSLTTLTIGTLFRTSFICVDILNIIMTSASTASCATEVQAFQKTIETALAQRGRHYSPFLIFAWRFEDDDTSASKDTNNFQSILKMLGLAQATELIRAKDDNTPLRIARTIC